MKQIINRKMYNTKTATMLGNWENMEDAGNFDWYSETLYRTKKGSYFLAKYWYNTRTIEVIDIDKAKDWAEHHMTADEYVEAFGPVEEA